MPYSTVVGMFFTPVGLIGLGFASSYSLILTSAACTGIGFSIFHAEATRMARNAPGERQDLVQGIFQVGGLFGGALGPFLAALIILATGTDKSHLVCLRSDAGNGAHGMDCRKAHYDPKADRIATRLHF